MIARVSERSDESPSELRTLPHWFVVAPEVQDNENT
jgi:hypothetical protein